MKVYIYDIEVFAKDWFVIFRAADDENKNYEVFHNDNFKLKQFMNSNKDTIYGGFNNKSYDDWIVLSMLNGADNGMVKSHNDFIIKGFKGWEFPFIKGQARSFTSFDLRDDLPVGLSLKAIEGNSGYNIVETGVDFDIDRELTAEEIEMTIEYCKTDVDNTLELYKKRMDYIETKKQVAELSDGDISEIEAMSLTNAKLTARFLKAKKIERKDEFEYSIPKECKIVKYKEVLEFFKSPKDYTINKLAVEYNHETNATKKARLEKKIKKLQEAEKYDAKLEMDIAGVPHIYANGGLHGAIKNYFMTETENYKMVTIDVGSYYPSMMLEYDYMSRNIPSKAGYKMVYDTRMEAKHTGKKQIANALKLVLNTCYGAMKNQYDDLYDPKNANAICITGQLLLTDLIEKLEEVKGFELIQSNTDGIIIRYPIEVEKDIENKVAEWEKRTRLNMEYTVIKAIAQKDVNNYVMKAGETYLIKNGEKVVTDRDVGKLKSKGGYVSLHGGGDFKNNSMVILHKALVNYFMEGIDVETTIQENNNIEDYQIIAKTGSTYDGTYHVVNGEKIAVQRCNRVFATSDTNYGTIYKRKNGVDVVNDLEVKNEDTGRSDKIASLPEHCIIDNENQLTIHDIDKNFYIHLAQKRVDDYLGAKKKLNKEGKKMATKKEETKREESSPNRVDYSKLNVFQKLGIARQKFLEANVKKTGVNRHSEFEYFQLADIVPVATQIFNEVGLLLIVTFPGGEPIGILYNTDNTEEKIEFASCKDDNRLETTGGKLIMMSVQEIGAKETYQRRYIYMQVLDIVENDSVDNADNQLPDTNKDKLKNSKKPATPKEREEITKKLINSDGEMTDLQKDSIVNGLKQLQEKDKKYMPFVKETLSKVKTGLTKEEAENLLVEIGNKNMEE